MTIDLGLWKDSRTLGERSVKEQPAEGRTGRGVRGCRGENREGRMQLAPLGDPPSTPQRAGGRYAGRLAAAGKEGDAAH